MASQTLLEMIMNFKTNYKTISKNDTYSLSFLSVFFSRRDWYRVLKLIWLNWLKSAWRYFMIKLFWKASCISLESTFAKILFKDSSTNVFFQTLMNVSEYLLYTTSIKDFSWISDQKFLDDLQVLWFESFVWKSIFK